MRRFLPSYPYSAALFRHGGRPAAGEDLRLDFSASINPLGPPPTALFAATRAWERVASYPDPECRQLRDLLAARHRVDPAQVVIGNGSNELIYLISRAWKPRRVAIVEPTYTEYLRASLLVGAAVDHWLPEEETWQPQPFDPQAAELVWLCQPNNPTGQLWPARTLAQWIEAHPGVRFVVDEAFLPFLPNEAEHSMIPALRRLPNLVVLRSLTKFYALPGLRIGYAVVSRGLEKVLGPQLIPWSVNTLAQAAALAALEDASFAAQTHAWLEAERSSFQDRLRSLARGWRVFPSRVNFLLVRMEETTLTAPELAAQLARRGLAIRDASNFIGLDERYFRVAIRSAGENRRLLKELDEQRIFNHG